MKLTELKIKLEDFLNDKSLHLFDLEYSKKDNILTVLIDENLSLDDLENLSNEISKFMDDYDEEFDAYILDVCNVGAERPIRNDEEIMKAIDSYIYIKTKEKEYYGYLKEFNNDELLIAYKDKTRDKTITLNKIEIKKIRYAVSFKGE